MRPLALLFAAAPLQAHVKWFERYDLTRPMTSATDVLTQPFVLLFLLSVVSVYAFFRVDYSLCRRGILAEQLLQSSISDNASFQIVRWSTCAFFATICIYGLLHHGFYLTPELHTDAAWVAWLQAAIALCGLHRRGAPLMGLGILALYLAAAGRYGFYHLLDYVAFPGIAYFLVAPQQGVAGWNSSRFVALYSTTGLTLMWDAIEKWACPSWELSVLEHNPGLRMGLSAGFFLTASGFVEFCLTFVMLYSVSFLARIIPLFLAAVFSAAVLKFGLIDAVGHLPFAAVLIVLVLRGRPSGREVIVAKSGSLSIDAYFMTGIYCLSLSILLIAYYGLHFLSYGN
jgi:hypothetical protein